MNKLELFIGPCVLESIELVDEVGTELQKIQKELEEDVKIHFKGSFDKANRTSIDSYRGPGLEKGLEYLSHAKEKYGLATITDFHYPEQALPVARVVDVLQVPAFLCRQTDMIFEGAKAVKENGGRLKIKKGQFISPVEIEKIVNKALTFLPKEDILITERGTSFGYNNLVVDMGTYGVINSLGVTSVHDATHCVQLPGGAGKITGGKREQIIPLARAAIAAGAKAIFMEVHPSPKDAKSDSTTCLPLSETKKIVKDLLSIYKLIGSL